MVEAVAPGDVGEVGTENKGAVGGIRGSGVCFVVRLAGLAAAGKRAVTVPLDFFLISI